MQISQKNTPVSAHIAKSDGDIRTAPVAVFDSGVGGLSVLREIHRILPGEDLLYFGDSQNAPYGEKPPALVREWILQHATRLLERAKALVLACNTATALAARELRTRFPDRVILGMEPALKPALTVCPSARVLVLATPITLQGQTYASLCQKYAKSATVTALPAPQIVEFVEKGELHSPALQSYLRALLAPCKAPPPDALVLGCTHFFFAKKQILQALGCEAPVFDGIHGTAAELARRLDAQALHDPLPHSGTVTFTSSKAGVLPLYARLFFAE